MPSQRFQLIPTTEELAAQFLGEATASMTGFETYADAYDALWHGYFQNLRPYQRWGDFTGQVELEGPRRSDFRHMAIHRGEYAVSKDGMKMFGITELERQFRRLPLRHRLPYPLRISLLRRLSPGS
jgi:hypothetical protein